MKIKIEVQDLGEDRVAWRDVDLVQELDYATELELARRLKR
jgi:hypothetical protein